MFTKPLYSFCSLQLLHKYFITNLRVAYYALLLTHGIIIITSVLLLCNLPYTGDVFWVWYAVYSVMCLSIIDINLIPTVYSNLTISTLMLERNNPRS